MPGEGAGEGMQAALQGADAGLGVADVARALVDACHMEEHKKVCVCVCVRAVGWRNVNVGVGMGVGVCTPCTSAFGEPFIPCSSAAACLVRMPAFHEKP